MGTTKEFLKLKGGVSTRVRPSQVMRTVLSKDRLGNQLLLISVAHERSIAFPASDENISELLDAGLRVHEYVCLDGQIDYREIPESEEHFKSARMIPEWMRPGSRSVRGQRAT